MKVPRDVAAKLLSMGTVSSKPLKPRMPAVDPAFDTLCLAYGLPLPKYEVEFALAERRRWRFDVLWDGWLALEIEGGAYTRGRHTRGKGFVDDIEKYNAAVLLGITILRCTPKQVSDGSIFDLVGRVLKRGPF